MKHIGTKIFNQLNLDICNAKELNFIEFEYKKMSSKHIASQMKIF